MLGIGLGAWNMLVNITDIFKLPALVYVLIVNMYSLVVPDSVLRHFSYALIHLVLSQSLWNRYLSICAMQMRKQIREIKSWDKTTHSGRVGTCNLIFPILNHILNQGLADIFFQGLDCKYLRLCGPTVSVTTIQPCHCNRKAATDNR